MCRLRLNFEYGTADEFQDMITNTATINLYVRNIHTTQSSANTIAVSYTHLTLPTKA